MALPCDDNPESLDKKGYCINVNRDDIRIVLNVLLKFLIT